MTSDAGIRFGFCLPVRPDETSPRRFAELYELCEVAEDPGYDFVAIPHHRFTIGAAHDAHFIADRDIAGGPEDCIAQIDGFHQITGCEYFLAAFGDSGGIEQTPSALELFGREVVPAFA